MRCLSAIVMVMTTAVAGCSDHGSSALQGYVEGTYVHVSAESAGRITERPVRAGDRVGAGDVLVRLDDADQIEALAAAEARLAQARAELANLRSGKRPEEIRVIEAELNEARSSFVSADEDYRRKLALRESGVVPQAAVDDAKARHDSTAAKVEATQRQLEVARLPARKDELTASERNVAALAAAVAQAEIALARRTILSPVDGSVEETFFEPGEHVAIGQSLISILPAANKKIRFFVPEAQLAAIALGDRVDVTCDNCPSDLAGEVDFIATEAEYTPPVIYSKDRRDKLVFRVEARPLAAAADLNVGQPVDVTLGDRGGGA